MLVVRSRPCSLVRIGPVFENDFVPLEEDDSLFWLVPLLFDLLNPLLFRSFEDLEMTLFEAVPLVVRTPCSVCSKTLEVRLLVLFEDPCSKILLFDDVFHYLLVDDLVWR